VQKLDVGTKEAGVLLDIITDGLTLLLNVA
jgi:hypothetical protein